MAKHNPLHLPWEARKSTEPSSESWIVWGHFPENAVQVSSLETGIGIQMPPERPLFTICPSEGVDPKLVSMAIVEAGNKLLWRKWGASK